MADKPIEICPKCHQPLKDGEFTIMVACVEEHMVCPFEPLWKPQAKAAKAGGQ